MIAEDPNRQLALGLAYQMHKDLGDVELHLGHDHDATVRRIEDEVRGTAEMFLAWLRGPTTLRLNAGPVTDQITGQVVSAAPTQGDHMTQITDTQEFTFTLDELDALGVETDAGVPPVWSSSDETVVPLNVSADGKSLTVVGSATVGSSTVSAAVTLADGTVLQTESEAVDVTAGGVTLIKLTTGPITEQAPAAPAEPAPVEAPAAPVV